MTLSDLLFLLRLALDAGGAAIDRLPERTVEAMAAAYLACDIWCRWSPTEPGRKRRAVREALAHVPFDGDPEFQDDFRLIDLADPGTAHAVCVALALSYGMDPGPMGLGVRLIRRPWGWLLEGDRGAVRVVDCIRPSDPEMVHAPEITTIPAAQPAQAIEAMVRHRLTA